MLKLKHENLLTVYVELISMEDLHDHKDSDFPYREIVVVVWRSHERKSYAYFTQK